MGSVGARPHHAGAGALRHLEEAVFQRLPPDSDRLEQWLVTRVAWHVLESPAWVRPPTSSRGPAPRARQAQPALAQESLDLPGRRIGKPRRVDLDRDRGD